jgi:hypothetical protein
VTQIGRRPRLGAQRFHGVAGILERQLAAGLVGALREASIAAPSRHPTNTYRRLVS